MSDLREAIQQAMSQADGVPERLVNDEAFDNMTDKAMTVFEAYLREHDAGHEEDCTLAMAAGGEMERERVRQRIEALPGVITGMEYVHGVREGNSAIVMRADVLEALGGSDE